MVLRPVLQKWKFPKKKFNKTNFFSEKWFSFKKMKTNIFSQKKISWQTIVRYSFFSLLIVISNTKFCSWHKNWIYVPPPSLPQSEIPKSKFLACFWWVTLLLKSEIKKIIIFFKCRVFFLIKHVSVA